MFFTCVRSQYAFFILINHGGLITGELLLRENIRGKTCEIRVQDAPQEAEGNDQSRTKSRDIAKLQRRKETTNG